MVEREFLTNSNEASMATVLKRELDNSEECIIISAFISTGLHNMLIGHLETAVASGKQIKILTSTMNNFNSPKVLQSFQTIVNQLKIFGAPGKNEALHVKSYLFSNKYSDKTNVIIIGSSNFTQQGLSKNKEWNILLRGDKDIFQKAYAEFISYWKNESFIPDDNFYQNYHQAELQETVKYKDVKYGSPPPNSFQEEALEKLQSFRSNQISKSIVIAATGTGKTYLAAFDFKRSKYDRILFIAHRINILESSKKTITSVMGSNFNSIIISGNSSYSDRLPNENISGVFAMVQTFSKSDTLNNWPPDYFDYIVIDEFHHAGADSYNSILEYFTPKFLLGLTATPERMDGRDVFKLCDNNIAFEIRLFTAIEKNLLVPFYYYAIYDEMDYEVIKWNGTNYNQEELEVFLSNDTRSKLVLKNLNRYLPSGNGKIKALGFCASKIHAQYMKSSFIKLGKSAEVVIGETTESERIKILKRLRNDNDDLEVVFSVDVFTEGVDIPDLTHILLLRPTQSFTVFQQQIGRGLRLHPLKEFVVILDFIGNYKNSFIPYLTLRGMSSANTIDIKKLQDNPTPPSNCFIDENTEVVKIQKERISQLFKPGNVEYLKNIYAEVKEDYEKISENSKIDHPLLLMDFFDHPSVDDIKIYLKLFGGNWLRVKEKMNDLSEFEITILNTKGEELLQHIEKELHPTKSYKMVVLYSIINKKADKKGWDIETIAKDFKNFYLQNKTYLNDYKEMGKATNPDNFPIKKVINHLIKMPLNYLSNNTNKFFNLDVGNKKFILKDPDGELSIWWNNPEFRILVNDRINYALKSYFFRKH